MSRKVGNMDGVAKDCRKLIWEPESFTGEIAGLAKLPDRLARGPGAKGLDNGPKNMHSGLEA